MAVPTITSVTPPSGHAGGKALVEIVGTNFQLEPDPDITDPDTVPLPPPDPPIRVLFGSGASAREASAQVFSSTRILLLTPKGDPFDQSTSWDSVDDGTDTITAAGHGLLVDTLVQLVAGTAGVLPAPLDADAPHFVVNPTTNTFQIAASEGGPAIDLTDAGTLPISMISDGAVDVTVENIDAAGVTIPGETVTATKVFKPLRPNLSIKGHLSEVIDTLIADLKRQVVKLVSWTTQMDYDEETGDLTVGFIAGVPALVLAGLTLPKSRKYAVNQQEEINTNDPVTQGDFVVVRPPDVRDLIGTLIGITDDDGEIANLAQAVTQYFQKNNELEVLRDPLDPTKGTIDYDLRASVEDVITFTSVGNNTDLVFFTMDVRVLGIRLETMPGIPQKTVPGVPSGIPVEPIVGIGKTMDTILVSSHKLPEP